MNHPYPIIRPNNCGPSFNMTPLIDIVFLLILFFVVVCQFIDADIFPVKVPDKCDLSKEPQDNQISSVTLTVMAGKTGETEFALGANKLKVEKITSEIDLLLKNIPSEQRVVTLRIDKDINFHNAKNALAAVSQSNARYVHFATLKNRGIEQSPSEQ